VPKRTSRTIKAARKAPARASHAAAPSRSYEDWLVHRLKNASEAAAYLESAMDDGDQGVLMLALRQVARAQGGVAAIARRSQLTREATYRMLSASGNPELKSLTALLTAAGLRLSVKPANGAKGRRSSRKQPVPA
jgi:probable addiction module antidote protein